MSLSSINIVLGAITEAYNASVNKAAETMDRVSKRMQKSADQASKGVGDALGSGQLRQKIENISSVILEQKDIYRDMAKELEDLRQKRDAMSKSDVQGQKAVRAEIERTKNGLKEISRDTAELTAKKQALTQQLSATNQSLGGTRAALNGLAASFSAVSSVVGIMAEDNKALRNTLMALNAALNFSAAIMQVKDLQEQFGGLTKFLTNPWVLASIAIAAAGAAIYAYSNTLSAAETAQREVNDELASATKSAKQNEVALMGYLAIVNDTTKSEKERSGALIALKEAGVAVDDINIKTAEGLRILNGRVRDSIDLAMQKAIVDRASARIAEIEGNKNERLNSIRKDGVSVLNKFREITLPGFSAAVYESNQAIDEAETLTNLYRAEIDKAQNEIANILVRTTAANEAQKTFNTSLKDGEKDAAKYQKSIQDLAAKELELFNLRNTANKNLENYLSPGDIVPTTVLKEIQELDEELSNVNEVTFTFPNADEVPEIFKGGPDIIATEIGKIPTAVEEMSKRSGYAWAIHVAEMEAATENTLKLAEKQKQAVSQINAAFATLQSEAMVSFGQFLGDLASGEQDAGKDFGKNMLGAIAAFMDSLGKALIATAVASEAFQKLILTNPLGAAAAGVALIAGAQIVRNSLKEGPNVTAFADGGIVSGPTLGLMGEYPGASTNPEVIAPLDKLKSLMKPSDSGSGFIASTHVSGRDLAIVLNRYNKDNQRG
jgi:chromosome segregation ATPase